MSQVQPRDRRIPYYFVAFFAFIALVDGIMVTLAVRTHTGLITEHPYEKGLAYNQVVQASNVQEALGWKGSITYHPTGRQTGELLFKLTDAAGKTLQPDTTIAHMVRPTQANIDFTLPLKVMETAVTFPAAGLWEIRIDAQLGDKRYQQSRRIVVE